MSLADAMNAVALVAERKIQEAMAEGQFDNLPGRGKPQDLEDLFNLPPELRQAYMILKSSGHLEASAEDLKPARLADLLSEAPEEGRVHGRLERLKFLMARLRRGRKKDYQPFREDVLEGLSPEYVEKLIKR